LKITVADAIAKILIKYDINHLFMLAGGDQSLFLALRKHGFKFILCRSEKSSVYIADGYARASGKTAFVYGQAGPGAANLAAGLADPYWGQTPILALTSATDEGSRYRYAYQELDQHSLFESVTKWNKPVPRPSRILDLLNTAILKSMSGSRGPVHIDIPREYFNQEIEVDDRWFKKKVGYFSEQRLTPEEEQVKEVLKMFNDAKKPIILAGSGSLLSGAGEKLLKLAEDLKIPVATSMGGKGVISEEHPLALGVVGRYSRKVANEIFSEADCVLVLGSRLGGLVTNGYKIPKAESIIIRMDIDSDTFSVTNRENISIICDVKAGLARMIEVVNSNKNKFTIHSLWAKEAFRRVEEWKHYVEEDAKTYDDSPIKPQTVINVINSLDERISLVADTGYSAAWTGVLYRVKEPGTYFRSIGSLGWGFPGSLGIQMAQPDRKVICVTGDGGIGYHICDIETAVRYKIPATIIVLNNSTLGFEYHVQKYHFNNQIISDANDFTNTNYAKVAKSFGAQGIRVETKEELKIGLKKAMKSNSLTVIDVVVDREQIAPVTNYEKIIGRKV